jgi:hypothetical protein
MRYAWMVGVLLGMIGCATPERIQREAIAHEQRATQLQAMGDYYGAAKERAAAQKQWNKAANRAAFEAQTPITPPMLK